MHKHKDIDYCHGLLKPKTPSPKEWFYVNNVWVHIVWDDGKCYVNGSLVKETNVVKPTLQTMSPKDSWEERFDKKFNNNNGITLEDAKKWISEELDRVREEEFSKQLKSDNNFIRALKQDLIKELRGLIEKMRVTNSRQLNDSGYNKVAFTVNEVIDQVLEKLKEKYE